MLVSHDARRRADRPTASGSGRGTESTRLPQCGVMVLIATTFGLLLAFGLAQWRLWHSDCPNGRAWLSRTRVLPGRSTRVPHCHGASILQLRIYFGAWVPLKAPSLVQFRDGLFLLWRVDRPCTSTGGRPCVTLLLRARMRTPVVL